MREHLETLTTSQSMFILTMMMLEGEKDLELIRYLPEEQAAQLEAVGYALAEQPRKQALPQIVREIKRLIKSSQRNPLELFAPEWTADFLKEEPPRVISALLQQYPRSSTDRIIMALPGNLRQNIPQLHHQIHPEIARYIKQKFDEKCPNPTQSTNIPNQNLSLGSLSKLESNELPILIKELGLREIAAAFRSAGKGPLTELCRVLNSEDAERLLHMIRTLPTTVGSPEAKEEMKSATRLLQATMKRSRSRSKSQLIDDAGLAKLREATFALPSEEQQAITFRLPHQTGKLFQSAQALGISAQETHRIQCEAIQFVQQLSQEGKISAQWGQLEAEYPPLPLEEE